MVPSLTRGVWEVMVCVFMADIGGLRDAIHAKLFKSAAASIVSFRVLERQAGWRFGHSIGIVEAPQRFAASRPPSFRSIKNPPLDLEGLRESTDTGSSARNLRICRRTTRRRDGSRLQDAVEPQRLRLVEVRGRNFQLKVRRTRIGLVQLDDLHLERRLPSRFASNLPFTFHELPALSSQMHSTYCVVSSKVNVAIFVPRFVSFVTTFEIMPTITADLISFVRSARSPSELGHTRTGAGVVALDLHDLLLERQQLALRPLRVGSGS